MYCGGRRSKIRLYSFIILVLRFFFFHHARSACDLSIFGSVYGVLLVFELELATLGLSCLHSISALPELDIKSILAFLASFIVASLFWACLAVVCHDRIELS